MRPLDILSITLVLCAMALVIALPMPGGDTSTLGASALTHGATLHYPGEHRQRHALLRLEADQPHSHPTLFNLNARERTNAFRADPAAGDDAPDAGQDTLTSLRYPAGRNVYSF